MIEQSMGIVASKRAQTWYIANLSYLDGFHRAILVMQHCYNLHTSALDIMQPRLLAIQLLH